MLNPTVGKLDGHHVWCIAVRVHCACALRMCIARVHCACALRMCIKTMKFVTALHRSQHRWDLWGRLAEPLTAAIPHLYNTGNHESALLGECFMFALDTIVDTFEAHVCIYTPPASTSIITTTTIITITCHMYDSRAAVRRAAVCFLRRPLPPPPPSRPLPLPPLLLCQHRPRPPRLHHQLRALPPRQRSVAVAAKGSEGG